MHAAEFDILLLGNFNRGGPSSRSELSLFLCLFTAKFFAIVRRFLEVLDNATITSSYSQIFLGL
jgi:hypothetical protein